MSLDQILMVPGFSSGGPRLVISDASESFDFEANSHSFFINSNLTWSWSSDVAWITSDEDTPQTGSQTFSYSVTENISTQRTGTITFTSGDITRTHTVTQGPYPILTIDDAAHTFDSGADSLTFNVTSNTDWTWFASEDWVTSSEAVFQNGNQAFTYSVTANTGAERTATITFVDVQAGVVTDVHSITQSAEATPLLLDSYTGAVGFSLRKIRTAYTGDCIRVRRESDNAEQDIGFSGNDLDTAAIETFCSGTTGYVTTWYDQVGSNDAVQATTTRQPIIYESGAVVVNEHGLPAIKFFDDDAAAIETNLRAPTWAVADAAWLAHSCVYSIGSFGAVSPIMYGSPIRTQHFNSRVRLQVVRVGGTPLANGSTILNLNTTTIRLDSADRTDIQVWLNTNTSVEATAADIDADASVGSSDIGGLLAATQLSNTLISEIIGFTTDESANNLAIRTDQYNYWTDVTPPAPLTLSIDSASATYNEDAQSGSFEVTSNTDWTWTSSAAWLTSAESSPQNGNQTFSYSVSENTGTERVATITLSITGTNVIHTVTQDAAPVPPVDPDIEDFTEFDYVADMVASMDSAKGAGQVWYAQGYRYVELDGSATDQHLTTAGGVKLRALQDGSGAVTTEQLGWLPAVVQELAAESQIPKLDSNSMFVFSDFYNCDDMTVGVPQTINISGAYRRHSGFFTTQQPGVGHRIRVNDGGGSLRRIKVECDQIDGGPPAARILSDRYIVDDVQMEHKSNSGIHIESSNRTFVHNCEFWDAHVNLYYTGGLRNRATDNYHTADWSTRNFGEGIKSGGLSMTDGFKVLESMFDRTRRDGIDTTGGGLGMRFVNNIFHLCGIGRDPANQGSPVQGIDFKVVSTGSNSEAGERPPTQHVSVCDNIFWGATILTTQTALDEASPELRWNRGLIGLMYFRNTFESKDYFEFNRGTGNGMEIFSYGSGERNINIKTSGNAGSSRNVVYSAKPEANKQARYFPEKIMWVDYANYIISPTGGGVNIDGAPGRIGAKMTGLMTSLGGSYGVWSRLNTQNEYIQVTASLAMYGSNNSDVLKVWSNGGIESPTPCRGFMASNCFGKDIFAVLGLTTGDNGLTNDCVAVGNIVKADRIVNDPQLLGVPVRTGLYVRQNTSNGAAARVGTANVAPIIEQNVGVS